MLLMTIGTCLNIMIDGEGRAAASAAFDLGVNIYAINGATASAVDGLRKL